MDSIRNYVAGIPNWAISALLIGAFVLAAWHLHRIVFATAERLVSGQDLFRRSLVARTKGPSRLAFILIGIALAVTVAPLTWAEGVFLATHPARPKPSSVELLAKLTGGAPSGTTH